MQNPIQVKLIATRHEQILQLYLRKLIYNFTTIVNLYTLQFHRYFTKNSLFSNHIQNKKKCSIPWGGDKVRRQRYKRRSETWRRWCFREIVGASYQFFVSILKCPLQMRTLKERPSPFKIWGFFWMNWICYSYS